MHTVPGHQKMMLHLCWLHVKPLFKQWKIMMQPFSTNQNFICSSTYPKVLRILEVHLHSILRGIQCRIKYSYINEHFLCRCESFNGLMRLHNLHSNRHASSYDIATQFGKLDYLRFVLQGGISRYVIQQAILICAWNNFHWIETSK